MTTSKNILLSLLLILIGTIGYSQQRPIVIDLMGPGEMMGAIEHMTEQVLITVRNESNDMHEISLVATVTGTTDAMGSVFASNETNAGNYPLTILGNQMLSFNLNTLIGEYQGSSFEDFYFGSTSPAIMQYITNNRAMPAGNYNVCLVAYDVRTGIQLSQAGTNNCLSFQVVYRDPPRILSPEDNTWIEEDPGDYIDFSWVVDGFSQYDRFTVEVVRFPTYEAVNDFMNQGKPDHLFNTYEMLISKDDISSWNFSTFEADIPPELEQGDALAVRVTAVNPTAQFLNQGRSEIHVFMYGVDHLTGCQNPNFSAEMIYPSVHDTLPFTDLFFVAKFDPSCDNLREVKTDLHYYRIQSGGGSTSTGPVTFTDRWVSTNGNHDGPRKFLENYFTTKFPGQLNFYLPTSSDYEKYLPFLHNRSSFSADRGDKIYTGIHMDFKYRELLGNTIMDQEYYISENIDDAVTIGMPKPVLLSPANNAEISPGSIEFRFETGNIPTNPLPPFKILKIEGMQDPISPGLNVKEKCVLQVATENTFRPENILHCRLKKIQNEPYDNRTSYDEDNPQFQTMGSLYDNTPQRLFDESHFLSNVYKEMNHSFDLNAEQTLYWRVVWLKDPDSHNTLTPCGSEATITEADIYHKSSVRKLIIKEGAGGGGIAEGGGSEDEEERSGDCGSPCNFTKVTDKVNFPHIAVDDIVKIAGFNMKIKSVTMESNTGSGVGHIKLPFLGGVEIVVNFSGMKINASKQVFAGIIKPVKDQQFEFSEKESGDFGKLFDMDKEVGEALITHLNHEKKMLSDLLNHEGAVTLPIGINKKLDGGEEIVIGVMAMTFEPDTAFVDLVLNIDVPDLNGTRFISLGASVCMTKDGFANDVRLYLPTNHEFPLEEGSDDPTTFIIKGAQGRTKKDAEEVTCVEFDCDGFRKLTLAGEVKFSRNVIVPDSSGHPKKKGNAKLSFLAHIEKNDDYMFNLSMDEFQVPDLDGWVFSPGNNMWIDLSDTKNPDGLSFPREYRHASLEGTSMKKSWKGFYMKSVGVGLPDYFEIRDGDPTPLKLNDLIIDNTGITFELAAENLISWDGTGEGKAELVGWKASLDKVYFKVIQNNPGDIGFKGKVGLPIADKTQFLKYTAELGQEHGHAKFFFSVEPKDDLKIPISMAIAKIKKSSYVKIVVGRDPSIEARLDASLTLGNDNLEEGRQSEMASTMSLPGLAVEKFVVNSKTGIVKDDFRYCIASDCETNQSSWHSGSGGSGSGESGSGGSGGGESGGGSSMPDEELLEAFALLESSGSGQGNMSGFPISLEKFEISNNGVIIKPALTITSGTNGISGSAEIEIGINTGTNFNEFTITEVNLKAIEIGLETSDITLQGRLEFYNETVDGVNKEGVKGGITLGITMGTKIEAKINGEFGTIKKVGATKFDTEDWYSYFYVDGLVLFSEGITLFSGVSLYGLGGGFYHHMKMVSGLPSGAVVLEDATEVAGEDGEPSPKSGVTYEPYFDTDLGIKFMAVLGSNDQGKAYNLDVTIQAEFSFAHGLTYFGFMGSFRAATDGVSVASIGKSDDSPIEGFLKLDLHMPPGDDYTLDGKLFVKVKVLPNSPFLYGIATSKEETDGDPPAGWEDLPAGWKFEYGMVWAHFYSSPVKNFFHMGTPDKRGGLKLSIAGFDLIEVTSYLMIGDDIPVVMPDPDEEFMKIFNAGMPASSEFDSADGNPMALLVGQTIERPSDKGKGFAMGLTLKVNTGDIEFFPFYFSLKMVMGTDINLTHSADRRCAKRDDSEEEIVPGIDGWYATGQLYAGIQGAFGIKINLFITSFKVNILEASAAMILKGGFPNPEWVSGKGSFYYNVCDGLAKGRCHFNVSVGNVCLPVVNNILGDLTMIQDISPDDGEEDVSVYSKMSVAFTMEMDKTFSIPEDVAVDEPPIIRYFTPYMKSFTVKPVGGNNITFQETKWNKDHEIYTVLPFNRLEEFTQYEATAEARVKEHGKDYKTKEGELVAEIRTHTFKTGPEPDHLEMQNIDFTYPYINQQNFLKEETVGYLGYIRCKFGDNKFLKLSPSSDTITTFYARLTSEDGEEKILDVNIALPDRNMVFFPVTELENNKVYCIQIIRKKKPRNPGITAVYNIDFGFNLNIYLEDGSTFQSDKLKKIKLPTEKIEPYEKEIFSYYFKTSKYNTMYDKLKAETIGMEKQRVELSYLLAYVLKAKNVSESMEWVDTKSFKVVPHENAKEFSPRAKIFAQPPVEILDGRKVETPEVPENAYLMDVVDPRMRWFPTREILNKVKQNIQTSVEQTWFWGGLSIPLENIELEFLDPFRGYDQFVESGLSISSNSLLQPLTQESIVQYFNKDTYEHSTGSTGNTGIPIGYTGIGLRGTAGMLGDLNINFEKEILFHYGLGTAGALPYRNFRIRLVNFYNTEASLPPYPDGSPWTVPVADNLTPEHKALFADHIARSGIADRFNYMHLSHTTGNQVFAVRYLYPAFNGRDTKGSLFIINFSMP